MTKKTTEKGDDFKILAEYKSYIWQEISTYLTDPSYPSVFTIPTKYKNKEHKKYWEMMRDYPERKGKYIRPILTLLTCEAMGGKKEDALKTAAAMQLSEDWILLDDDVMDNSLLRRGKPTFHRLYGVDQAVVIGDALQTITYKILSDNYLILSPQKTYEVFDEMYRIISRTCEGQSIEAMWTKDKRFDISEEDYFFAVDGKTCFYSIAGPMRLGAIISGATEKQLDALAEFGIYLGRSFQLIDDILGVTSDFGNLKQKAGDIYEGKTTLLFSHLTQNASVVDKKKALAIIQKPFDEKNESEVEWVVSKMHEYGSIEYAQKLADEYKEKAYRFFENKLSFLSKEPARSNLFSLIEFVLERSQ